MKHKAIFLDRDGVINKNELYYTFKKEDVIINEGIEDALKLFSFKGYLLVVITNQSGVAKKLYSVADVEKVHTYIQNCLKEYGITFTAFYFCPHHPEIGKCICRKPDSLLIEKAAARFQIDLSDSYFIGDSERDIQAASKVGVKGLLIQPNTSILPLAQEICR